MWFLLNMLDFVCERVFFMISDSREAQNTEEGGVHCKQKRARGGLA